jgi:hypothetical protein
VSKTKDFYWDEISKMPDRISASPLTRIKALLGDRYVFHPKYTPLSRHSNVGDKWVKYSVLAGVRVNAVALGRL